MVTLVRPLLCDGPLKPRPSVQMPCYRHIFPIKGRSARQSIIFRVLSLKQGIQFYTFLFLKQSRPRSQIFSFSPPSATVFYERTHSGWRNSHKTWPLQISDSFSVIWECSLPRPPLLMNAYTFVSGRVGFSRPPTSLELTVHPTWPSCRGPNLAFPASPWPAQLVTIFPNTLALEIKWWATV